MISTSGQNAEKKRLIFLGHELQPPALLQPCLVPITVKFLLTSTCLVSNKQRAI
jgi:hypothetical protein